MLYPLALSCILDEVHNGHHGDYERFQGLGYSRAMCKDILENKARRNLYKSLQTKLDLMLEENEALKEWLRILEAAMLEK